MNCSECGCRPAPPRCRVCSDVCAERRDRRLAQGRVARLRKDGPTQSDRAYFEALRQLRERHRDEFEQLLRELNRPGAVS